MPASSSVASPPDEPYNVPYNEERYGTPVPVERRAKHIERIGTANSWFGVMTRWNAEAIHRRIRRMLTNKQYTFVSMHSGYNAADSVDVRTSQIVEGSVYSNVPGDEKHIIYNAKEGSASITVCDSYGVWSICTYTDSGDHMGYRNPYLVFDHGRAGEQLKIVHLNGLGEVIVWKIAVEDPDALKDKLSD